VRGFSLTVDRLAPSVVCVALRGELDVSRALLLDQQLRDVESTRPEALVIDLRGLHFVDSSGVGRLVSAHRRALRSGRRVIVVRGNAVVQRILEMSALDRAFELVDDPRDAVAAVLA
jgi:anti-anti-sigma factor